MDKARRWPAIAAAFTLLLGTALFALAQDKKAAPPEADKTQANFPLVKEFRIERGMSKQGQACIECHKVETPGLFADWAASRHAAANITCIDCHQAQEFDADVTKKHYKQYERADNKWGTAEYRVPIAGVVTPKDCSRCHPDEVKQYSRSKQLESTDVVYGRPSGKGGT